MDPDTRARHHPPVIDYQTVMTSTLGHRGPTRPVSTAVATTPGPVPAATDEAAPPPAPVPVRLSRPRRLGRIGGVGVGQVVAVQVAVVAAGATYPQPDLVFLPVLGAGLLLVAAAFARRGGRWWYEDMARRWRFRRRRARGAADGSAPAGDSTLSALAPGLFVREVTDRGLRIGIGMDGDGWFAAISVTAPAGGAARPDWVGELLADTAVPVSALQVVHHTVPSPTVVSPAGEQTWVALRLESRDAPTEARNRGGGVEGVHRTITAAVGRLGRTLRASGLGTHVLTADELVAALAAVGGWDHTGPATGGRGHRRGGNGAGPEHWTEWRGADGAHVCFRLRGTLVYPDLYDGLSQTSALSATVSVRFPAAPERLDPAEVLPPPAEPERHGLLRIAAPQGGVDATASRITAAVRRLGLSAQRLDGEHAPALYATAPTAADLR